MTRHFKAVVIAVTTLALCSMHASAQSPKELKTKSGTSMVVVNFLDPRPDCSANPGPIAVPVILEAGNRTTSLSYRITVQAAAEQL